MLESRVEFNDLDQANVHESQDQHVLDSGEWKFLDSFWLSRDLLS